ncbi:DUF2505 domain-containing protein [Parasphingopyxis lamellibrachiae]|uniref:Uncharacterized protein DUF2505 n=1 Tax=Parasphingopyxis lamellibrachiae TaxID=680125 RepID=A0A3D9FGT8_9SPHN|nr:DUF2505 domain-containing protein [Parasphingopyxis lamellibrachiae]RED17009.1 uncharacterized protein DUF2505 [Parasphingopyxis lamellibrachiae]
MQRISLAYDIAADIDLFCRSFWDEDFVLAKFRALGARAVTLSIGPGTDGEQIVTSEREVPMDAPPMLQAVIGEWSKVHQVESWSGEAGGPYRCDIEVRPEGLPASARGEIIVEANGDGCTLRCETDAICTVPMVGRMAEKFMAADIGKRLDAEVAHIAASL